jgi:hypothetical protein
MSDLDKRLAEMRGRSDAATEGPWVLGSVEWVYGSVEEHMAYPVSTHDGHEISHDSIEEDAEFIAHARTDLDDLRGAVEDVLGLADAAEDHQAAWLGVTAVRAAITKRLGGA